MSDMMCPSKKEVNVWGITLILANVLLTLLVSISLMQYRSSACIQDSLQTIQITFAKHLGQHEGIADRIKKLESQVVVGIEK